MLLYFLFLSMAPLFAEVVPLGFFLRPWQLLAQVLDSCIPYLGQLSMQLHQGDTLLIFVSFSNAVCRLVARRTGCRCLVQNHPRDTRPGPGIWNVLT